MHNRGGQDVPFDITVPKADEYNIVINIEPATEDDLWMGNFLWTADPNQEHVTDREGNILYEN